MRDNGFKLAKERSKKYPTQTITDADYTDDIALRANTPTQAETLLHSLERAAASIGLDVNADKTEYMCFNQWGDIKGMDNYRYAIGHMEVRPDRKNKMHFFQAAVVSILLFGCTT